MKTEKDKNQSGDGTGKQIEKLIAFFKNLPHKRPKPGPADYSEWDQTEDQYQKQQAAWLAKVARRKNQKSDQAK